MTNSAEVSKFHQSVKKCPPEMTQVIRWKLDDFSSGTYLYHDYSSAGVFACNDYFSTRAERFVTARGSSGAVFW